jgi:hypothetical protein
MLKKAFKSPNPALNIYRRNKDVACDTVYSDIPAIFDRSTAAVIFVGTSTRVTNVHGIKKDNQFANTFSKIILFNEVLPIAYLVTEANLLSVTKLKISYARSVSPVGRVNLTSTTKTQPNDATRP